MIRFAFLVSALFVLTAAQPACAANLTSSDQAILATLAESLERAAPHDGFVWPGFRVSGQPLVIYDQGRLALLLNHPKPPLGFSRLAQVPAGLKGKVYAHWGEVPALNRKTEASFNFGSVRTTFIPYQYFSFGDLSSLDLLTPMFAAYSQQQFRGMSELTSLAQQNLQAIESPETTALANLENRILAQALQLKIPNELLEHGRYLRAVRKERFRKLPAKARRFEGLEESLVGSMRYTLTRYAQPRAAQMPERDASRTPDFQALRMVLQQPIDNEDSHRSHLSVSGAALGLILDRLGEGRWKERIKQGQTLSDVFFEVSRYRDSEGPALLRSAKSRFGYDQLLGIAKNPAARYPASYQEFLKTPGPRWTFAGLPRVESDGEQNAKRNEWLRITAPNVPEEIDEKTLFVSQMEGLDYRKGETTLLIKNTHLAMQSSGVAWPFENLTLCPKDPKLWVELDGKAFVIKDGSYPFQSLRIGGARINMSTPKGTLKVMGQNIVVTLAD